MQPLVRSDLIAEQVTYLLREAEGVTVGRGCELIGRDLQVVEDISADFRDASVSRSSYATLHGTGQFQISRDLDWGADLIRPYMTLSDGTITARFNLGAYFPSAPRSQLLETPRTHEVQGYDILHALNDLVGASYAVPAGTSYLVAVQDILTARGYPTGSYVIDLQRVDAYLPSDQVWVLDSDTRWLTIVNDLLAAVGYAGIWSDWDGRLRVRPYQSPTERAVEWVYDTEQATSMVEPGRELEQDYFDAPNRWVFVRQNNTEGPAPVEGDGIYTFTNETAGPASVDARRGRVVTAPPVFLDVADHEALVRQAQVTIDADMLLPRRLSVSTFPNPLHWHFDLIAYDDPQVARQARALCTSWSLPLSGGAMTHEWALL